MKFNKVLFISLASCALTLSGCDSKVGNWFTNNPVTNWFQETFKKSSSDTSDTETSSNTDTNSQESGSSDTNTNTTATSSDTTTTNTTTSSEDSSTTSSESSTHSSEDTSTTTSSETTSSSEPDPEPVQYKINVTCSEHASYEFKELDPTAVYANTNVEFKVTVEEGYSLDVVKMNSTVLTSETDTYSFTMPESDVELVIECSLIPAPATYVVRGVNTEHTSFNVLGEKEEFSPGDNVMFTASANYGYKINSFVITRDDTNEVISYTGTTLFEFTMPESDVTVTFDVEQLYKIATTNSAHSVVKYSPDKDYYAAGSQVSFTVSMTDDNYEVDTITVRVVKPSSTITPTQNGDTYTFTMPASNVLIIVKEKEKPASIVEEPFTSPTKFEGTWDYYDGYYDYEMRLRIEFDGSGKLAWYLTYEDIGGDDWWTSGSTTNGPLVKNKAVSYAPSDMNGTLKAGETENTYTFDPETDQIKYTTKVKTSMTECTLQLIRSGASVTSIKMLNNMSGDFYQSKDCVLKKI